MAELESLDFVCATCFLGSLKLLEKMDSNGTGLYHTLSYYIPTEITGIYWLRMTEDWLRIDWGLLIGISWNIATDTKQFAGNTLTFHLGTSSFIPNSHTGIPNSNVAAAMQMSADKSSGFAALGTRHILIRPDMLISKCNFPQFSTSVLETCRTTSKLRHVDDKNATRSCGTTTLSLELSIVTCAVGQKVFKVRKERCPWHPEFSNLDGTHLS